MVLSLALWGALVGAPALPTADEPLPASIDLRWNAPPGCSSAEAIQRRIEALLSGPPRGDGEALVVADVTAVAGGVAMTLTTTFAGATDVREVSSASCDALAEATAVLLAVSLEPGLEEEPKEPAAVPEPEPESTVAVPEPEAPAPLVPPTLPDADAVEVPVQSSPAPQARRRPSVYGLVGSGVESGALGRVTALVRAGLGLAGADRPWLAELYGLYLVPRRAPGGLYQLGAAGVRGCWTPGQGSWQANLCLGAEGGAFRVDSRGLGPRQVGIGPSLGPSLGGGVLWRPRKVGLFVRGEAVPRVWGSRTLGPDSSELNAQQEVSLRLTVGVVFGKSR